MSVQSRPSTFRSRTAKLAVAGAAGLATVFTIVPAAVAADEGPDTTEPTASVDDTATPPVVEAPDTTPEETAAGGQAAADDEAPIGDEDGTEELVEPVEADFGFQKFRVGVKLADGATVPDGVTTAGTTIRIVIRDEQDEIVDDFTCDTDTSTLDTVEDATATYCSEADDPELKRAAEARSAVARSGVEVDDEDDSTDFDQIILLVPGETARITQVSDIEGVERPTEAVTIDTCDADEGDIVCPGDNEEGFLQTEVLFVNDDPSDDSDDSDDPSGTSRDDALLPDTGGADLRLLGLGVLMLGTGGVLTAQARRTPRRTGAHAG